MTFFGISNLFLFPFCEFAQLCKHFYFDQRPSQSFAVLSNFKKKYQYDPNKDWFDLPLVRLEKKREKRVIFCFRHRTGKVINYIKKGVVVMKCAFILVRDLNKT